MINSIKLLVGVAIPAAILMAPSILAWKRSHPNKKAILLLNIMPIVAVLAVWLIGTMGYMNGAEVVKWSGIIAKYSVYYSSVLLIWVSWTNKKKPDKK